MHTSPSKAHLPRTYWPASSPHLPPFPFVLWAIWTARRKAIHEEIYQSPMSTHDFIQSFLVELQALNPPSVPSVHRHIRPASSWIRPPTGMVKINVDGAFARTGRSCAASAVCRGANGSFLGSSAMVFTDIDDPAILESLACREESSS